MPDITRLFRGRKNEFEVEVVFAAAGEASPMESHDYQELIVIASGVVRIKRGDDQTGEESGTGTRGTICTAPDLIVIPAGVEHRIQATVGGTKVVIIHPDRL